ncbi:MAG: hypothetical protein HKN42_07280 [Granulosicoccus sp.]|nr:hypothetical protein [Granulosicoccus sp.]
MKMQNARIAECGARPAHDIRIGHGFELAARVNTGVPGVYEIGLNPKLPADVIIVMPNACNFRWRTLEADDAVVLDPGKHRRVQG